ncbi:MAG TPA: hypothetical protein VF725_08890 [Ktedonobacterales bacterium]
MAEQWEYLVYDVSWDSTERKWTETAVEGISPGQGTQAVFNYLGSQGWELAHYGPAGGEIGTEGLGYNQYPTSYSPRLYRSIFKRRKP